MKKLLCIVLAIAILTGVLTLPVSAVSQNTSDKYAEQFEQYLTNIGHTPYYKGEKLYFYYELYEYYSDTNTSDTPDWVLAEGGVNTASPAGCNGIFGKYNLVLCNIYCPYSLLYHIYVPSQNKFYTLSDAWTERIEGLDNAFTEYLVPNKLAELIEDADGDGKITEFDASKYDGYFTYYNSFEECISDDQTQNMISVKDAIAEYEAQTGEKVETNRYYFLMPNGENGMRGTEEVFLYNEYAPSWYNSNTDTAGVYWWDSGIADPEAWPGYTMEKSYSDDIYYADVPELVYTLVFNNYVNGGMDPQAPIYQDAYQTSNIYTSYDKGDSTLYPDGLDNCDGMIYVINPSLNHRNECIEPKDWPGEWYYYYGDGCYGTVKDGDIHDCIRDDHNHTQSIISVKDAIAEYEAKTGEKVETNRYYFLMPNGTNGEKGDNDKVHSNGFPESEYYDKYTPSWYNEYTIGSAGIYWWDSGIADPEKWPGYVMEKGDSDSVFYADVPTAVTTIIFNNLVDGGMDYEADIYYATRQSINIQCEYYDADESDTYPDGLDSFDNMIYVIDPDLCYYTAERPTYGGEWYYYYGDGCYGTVKDGDTSNCIRDDHDHKYLFKDKLISKYDYEPNTAEYMDYEEMYYHYDENGNMDWVLLYANVHNTAPWIYNIIFRDRILMCGTNRPFSFGYGIYDVKADEFHDIITDEIQNYFFDLSAYDGLEEVFDSLKLGYPIGDANHDHELSIMDATQIQLVLAKLATFDDEDRVEYYHGYKDWSELGYPKYISDINCDGDRNIMDATAIQMKLAKLA